MQKNDGVILHCFLRCLQEIFLIDRFIEGSELNLFDNSCEILKVLSLAMVFLFLKENHQLFLKSFKQLFTVERGEQMALRILFILKGICKILIDQIQTPISSLSRSDVCKKIFTAVFFYALASEKTMVSLNVTWNRDFPIIFYICILLLL